MQQPIDDHYDCVDEVNTRVDEGQFRVLTGKFVQYNFVSVPDNKHLYGNYEQQNPWHMG